jgi:4-amino-4-deoxy-L-arabinose transferase-like glycosyltransferase
LAKNVAVKTIKSFANNAASTRIFRLNKRSTLGYKLDTWQIVIAALVLLAIRISYGPITDLALFYDEAYYHYWSTELDWGYYSKPPLIAWLIFCTTHLFNSHAEWAVRLASPILYFVSAFLIYGSTRCLYNRLTGLYAAAIFYSTPLVSFNSLFITTDAPLLFCWSLAVFCYVYSSRSQHWWPWVGLGASIGLGLLAKYTMIVWVLGFILYGLWQKTFTRQFFSNKTLTVFTMASLLVLPNLIWNWQHNFISYRHTVDISKLDQTLFHPSHLLEFIAGQFLVFGPIGFYLLLHLFWRPYITQPLEKLLVCLSLPLLLGMALQALLAQANMNWTAPVYITASILLARALINGYKYKLIHLLLLSNLVIGGVFYLYPYLQQRLNIEPTVKNTPFHRVAGWKPLFQAIPQEINHAENQVWLSNSRMLLSYLHYYLPHNNKQQIQLVSFSPADQIHDQFALHQSLMTNDDSNYIYLSERPINLTHCFKSVQFLAQVKLDVYPSLQRELYLYYVAGFQGYERC